MLGVTPDKLPGANRPSLLLSKQFPLLALTCWLGTSGCATPASDWNSRVGNYTYTDMVSDYGTPLTSQTSAGSGTIAQWVVYRERPAGGHFREHNNHNRNGGSQHGSPPIWLTDYVFEMTFDSAGRLTAWKKIDQ